MTPAQFPQVNTYFRAPEGYTADQVQTIPACICEISKGNMDGAEAVIVAWKPTPEEVDLLNAGEPVFIGFLGGVPPHFVTVGFPAL